MLVYYLSSITKTFLQNLYTDATGSARVKLPKLSIRPFRGELTAWTTFWDCYEAAIHKNTSVSAIDKFNYLRSLLESTALESISGLTLTAANYDEAGRSTST